MNKTKPEVIETARLRLRKFTMNDAAAILELLGDPQVNTYLPMMTLSSLEEAQTYLAEHWLTEEKPASFRYAVCLKETGQLIGYARIASAESHDLGYAFRKDCWGRGYASEAAAVLMQTAAEMGVPYLTATHDVNNPGSGGVMRKIGMHYQYSYEEQWQPKNFPVTFRMYQINFTAAPDFVYQEYWNQSAKHWIEKLD